MAIKLGTYDENGNLISTAMSGDKFKEEVENALDKRGDTMDDGATLTLGKDPENNMDAVPKKYVDKLVYYLNTESPATIKRDKVGALYKTNIRLMGELAEKELYDNEYSNTTNERKIDSFYIRPSKINELGYKSDIFSIDLNYRISYISGNLNDSGGNSLFVYLIAKLFDSNHKLVASNSSPHSSHVELIKKTEGGVLLSTHLDYHIPQGDSDYTLETYLTVRSASDSRSYRTYLKATKYEFIREVCERDIIKL